MSQKKEHNKWPGVYENSSFGYRSRSSYIKGWDCYQSGAASTLVKCSFADTALGTPGTAHRATGAAVWRRKGRMRGQCRLTSTSCHNSWPVWRPTSCSQDP
jgi:hypothetical protein